MLTWIQTYGATLAGSAVILGILLLIIIREIRRRRAAAKSGCPTPCAGCPSFSACNTARQAASKSDPSQAAPKSDSSRQTQN